MQFRTAKELGALVRARRKELGMSQQDLAEKSGVRRLWVIQFEAGKPSVELGLVLRTLRALDVVLQTTDSEVLPSPEIDLNDLVDGED